MKRITSSLKKFPLTRAGTQISSTTNQPNGAVDTNLRPPKANRTLKRFLDTNAFSRAFVFFKELLKENHYAIDSYSVLFVLKACTQNTLIVEGRCLHAVIKKLGFEGVIHLQTLLIDFYSTVGNLDDARSVFDEIAAKNTVCWTSMMSAYVDNDQPGRALEAFEQLQRNGLALDRVTLTVALAACANVGELGTGEWIHDYIRCNDGLKTDLSLNNALINMYGKCGQVERARKLFRYVKRKDVTTWTSMILGHALHGQVEEALELFEEMKWMNRNVIPNDITFLAILMACSHAGLVEKGKEHFKSMINEYHLSPRMAHFGSVVDLLCRAGLVNEAYEFLLGMPVKPNAVMWQTLLGACSFHGNIELVERVRVKMIELEPDCAGGDVTLSNIYAAQGLWDAKMMVREKVRCRRTPSCSAVGV